MTNDEIGLAIWDREMDLLGPRAEADGEGATLGSTVDALIAEIDSGAHPAEDAAIVVGQLIRWREQKYPEGDRGD